MSNYCIHCNFTFLQFWIMVFIVSTQTHAKNVWKLWKVYFGLFKPFKYVIYRLNPKTQPHFPVRSNPSAINNVSKCCSHQPSTSQCFSYYYLFVDLFAFFSPSSIFFSAKFYSYTAWCVVNLVECLANTRKHTNTWQLEINPKYLCQINSHE